MNRPAFVPKPGRTELVVAVDTPSLDEARRLRDRLAGTVSWYKVGKELFAAAGPRAVSEFTGAGRVFLDLKFHDIPATVAGAVRAAAATGASIVDVHASGGRAMLRAASAAAREAPAFAPVGEPPLLLAVTVLTHLDAVSFREVFGDSDVRSRVLRLARLAGESGAGGVVASPEEIEPLREAMGDRFVLLTPGVRPDWSPAAHDQRRVATPGAAARRGADYIVVGRAITTSADPGAAARRILDELDSRSALR